MSDDSARMTVEEFLDENEMSMDEALETYAFDSVVPALCSGGCCTEPDGYCEHGYPSILLELGIF